MHELQRNHICHFCGEAFPKSSSRIHKGGTDKQSFHEKKVHRLKEMLSRKSLLHKGIQLPRNTDLSKDEFDFD